MPAEPVPAEPGVGVAVRDRIEGGLLGVAAGDALGATCEFASADELSRRGRHTEITGGGVFGWRPGQGTDDTDMTYAVARAYTDGFTLERVAGNFLAWFDKGPRDVGGVTAAALGWLRQHQDPRASGRALLPRFGDRAAGNGGLMRALPTALARRDPAARRAEAAAVSAVTHADPRCVDAAVLYCDLAALLLEGRAPAAAVEQVLTGTPAGEEARDRLAGAPGKTLSQLRPTGYVLDTLEVAVWAVSQPASLEECLIEIVNLGDDADTTGAVAGGLLGVRDGSGAIPPRWLARLEYRERLAACVDPLAALWREGGAGRDGPAARQDAREHGMGQA